MEHTLLFTIPEDEVWKLSPQCSWLWRWQAEHDGRSFFYQGIHSLTDEGDVVAVMVRNMADDEIIEFKLRFKATIHRGDPFHFLAFTS